MKIRSKEILKARIAEGLSHGDVTKHLGKCRSWLSKIEHGRILVGSETEARIVALIHRLGALRRTAAVEERKLAAEAYVPSRAPSHRDARA